MLFRLVNLTNIDQLALMTYAWSSLLKSCVLPFPYTVLELIKCARFYVLICFSYVNIVWILLLLIVIIVYVLFVLLLFIQEYWFSYTMSLYWFILYFILCINTLCFCFFYDGLSEDKMFMLPCFFSFIHILFVCPLFLCWFRMFLLPNFHKIKYYVLF